LEGSGLLLYEALVLGKLCPQFRRNLLPEYSRLFRSSNCLWTAGPFKTKATTHNHALEDPNP